jgi:hypothetical protein
VSANVSDSLRTARLHDRAGHDVSADILSDRASNHVRIGKYEIADFLSALSALQRAMENLDPAEHPSLVAPLRATATDWLPEEPAPMSPERGSP